MLNDIGEIARETKVLGQLIGGCNREVIVEPIIAQVSRSNLCTISCSCSEIVVCKSSHEIALGILDCGILALQALPFQASTVVEVQLLGDVPIVSEVKSQLVLSSLVILRCILVEIIEVVTSLVGIPNSQGITSIGWHALVVHRGVGSIVDVVIPLVQTYSYSRCIELLAQLCGEKHLVDGSCIEARHTSLNVLAIVSLGLTINVTIHIMICSLIVGTLQVDDGHRGLIYHGTT